MKINLKNDTKINAALRAINGRSASFCYTSAGELRALTAQRPITADELRAVVRNETLSLPGRNESLGQLAGSAARILSLNLPDDYYNQLVGQLNSMSLDQVHAGARKLVHPDALTWVLIGDMAAHRAALDALGWGPVTELTLD